VIAFAKFNTAEAAEMAAKDPRPEFLKGHTICIEQIHWIKCTIPSSQFKILKVDLDGLQTYNQAKIRYYDRDAQGLPADPVCIHIYAADQKAFGRLKVTWELLLRGELLVSNGKGLWDEYFSTGEGAYFIRKLNADSGFFIKCDTRTRTLRFYGPVTHVGILREMITRQLGDVYARRHVISIRKGLVRFLVTRGLDVLQGDIGPGKVTLDVVAPSLTVRGDSGDVKRVQRALVTMDSTPGHKNFRNADMCCPVCSYEATDVDAIVLSCGHVYCKPCLQHLLRSAAGPNFTMPRCIAEMQDGVCNTDITLNVIGDMLSSAEEKSLLESSFSSHIRGRPKEFQYCPTPDCQVTYRPGDSGTILHCPSCLTRICPTCQVDFHEGLTCAEYRDNFSRYCNSRET